MNILNRIFKTNVILLILYFFYFASSSNAEKCDSDILSWQNYDIPFELFYHPNSTWDFLGTYTIPGESYGDAWAAGYKKRVHIFPFVHPELGDMRCVTYYPSAHPTTFNKAYAYYSLSGTCPLPSDSDGDGILDKDDLDAIETKEKNLGNPRCQ